MGFGVLEISTGPTLVRRDTTNAIVIYPVRFYGPTRACTRDDLLFLLLPRHCYPVDFG
jgi:hypothetical protein